MKNYISEDLSFADVYQNLLYDLKNNCEFKSKPRDQNIHEFLGCSLTYDPLKALYFNERRSSQLKYICAEIVWYFCKSNKLNFINKFSKFWNQIVNPDKETVNSAYGYLIFDEKISTLFKTDVSDSYLSKFDYATNLMLNNKNYQSQWQWAIKQLLNDKDTRQAVIHYQKPHHQFDGNKDFVCTMYQSFMIRDNKLYSHVHMRSNDAILGLPTDVAFFSILMIVLQKLLKQLKYPELELGTMTHVSDSMHYYDRNEKLINEMLQHDFSTIEMIDIPILIDEHNVPNNFLQKLEILIMNDDFEKIKTLKYNNDFEKFMIEHLTK